MKVYIVFWAHSDSEWRVSKVFSEKGDADAYIKGKRDPGAYWCEVESVS